MWCMGQDYLKPLFLDLSRQLVLWTFSIRNTQQFFHFVSMGSLYKKNYYYKKCAVIYCLSCGLISFQIKELFKTYLIEILKMAAIMKQLQLTIDYPG